MSTTTTTATTLQLIWQHYRQRQQQLHLQKPPSWFTIRQLNRLLAAGVITCEDLCRYCYATAQAGEEIWNLGAFERLVPLEDVLEQARESDQRRTQKRRQQQQHQEQQEHGDNSSLLDGIPVSIKANLAVATQPLTAGSRILGSSHSSSDVPAVGYSGQVCHDLLQSQGAVLMGMTSMDEFGMGSLGSHTHTGAKNPRPYLVQLLLQQQQQQQQQQNNNAATENNDSSSISKLLKLPSDAILEAHAQLLEQIQNNNTTTDDDKESSSGGSSSIIYSAGGSSCGSAISVAFGSSVVSLGSDTGGSVRLPAAWCGIIGFKPSYGSLSRHGLVAYASSLDTVGILASSVDCAHITYNALLLSQQEKENVGQANTMIRDSTQHIHRTVSNEKNGKTNTKIKKDSDSLPLSGMTVGIPAAFSVSDCPKAVRDAWIQGAQLLEQQGATVKQISTDSISPSVLQQSLAAYYVLTSAEASSNLARYDGFRYGINDKVQDVEDVLVKAAALNETEESSTNDNDKNAFSVLERQYATARTLGFRPEVIRRVLCGTSVLSADRLHTYYEAAAKLRAKLTKQLHSTLQHECDLLLVPTVLFPPPPIICMKNHYYHSNEANDDDAKSSSTTSSQATEMFANDVMTVPISLAGLPAVSVPMTSLETANSCDSDWPTNLFSPALQLVAARHDEETLLRAAAALEQASSGKVD